MSPQWGHVGCRDRGPAVAYHRWMHSSAARLPPHPEDEAREARARGDHRGALTILMHAYGRDLHRHCFQVLRDRDLADDVHQTVFVQAYRDLPGFAGRSSLRTWLYGIARHRCLDAMKIGARWRRRFVRADGGGPPDGWQDEVLARIDQPAPRRRARWPLLVGGSGLLAAAAALALFVAMRDRERPAAMPAVVDPPPSTASAGRCINGPLPPSTRP
jgi:DNA-directed RNA polymerase specialized sigma24 family protein